jgi:hypothetical protein
MSVATQSDGSVIISPADPTNQVIVMGDPSSGLVEAIEAIPVVSESRDKNQQIVRCGVRGNASRHQLGRYFDRTLRGFCCCCLRSPATSAVVIRTAPSAGTGLSR